MKKQLLLLFVIFCCVEIHAQNDDLWQRTTSVNVLGKKANTAASGKLYYKLNSDFLKDKLAKTTGQTSKEITSEITVPNSSGTLERFKVWESSNFDPDLQAKYPEIRSYEGQGVDDKTAKIYFSVAPVGMQTMVLRADQPSEYIEKNPEDSAAYVLYTSKNSLSSASKLECSLNDAGTDQRISGKTAKPAVNNKVFKTLRLAISCTGEYTAYFGGTKVGALSGINASLTRVNGIFNRDLAVRLVMIANTDAVIYTNATTDPYSAASKGTSKDTDGNFFWSKEVQSTLTSVIGEANYDMGHLFGGSGGGGNAGCIGCICVSPTASNVIGKGSAYTSPSDGKPQGDTFDIDYVAHEMGHQLGGSHTFSSEEVEGMGTNVEPGSGSTIMGYAGVTDFNVQDNSDDYFAYASIIQIQNNLATKSCPVSIAIANNPPTVNAGRDYTIPISTAFVLKGTGSDAEGDSLTYNWEQRDSATTTTGENSIAYPTKPDGPLFRSVIPNASPVRYMPELNSVIQNQLTTKWESVSSVARTLHFTLTARDNAALGTGQTNTAEMIVTVAPFAGPLKITSHVDDNVSWWQGLSETVTWSVNNTNTLEGSTAVNIKLSTDGGLTFPILLVASTPNDGSETITMPTSVPSSKNCRILIEPTGNIYYALNLKPFAVGYTSSTICNSYSFGSSFSIPNTTTFFTKTVEIPASEAIVSDVNVSVNVTHTRFSDLEIQIVNPQGTVVRLFNKNCAATNSTLAMQFDDSGIALECLRTTEQIVLPVDMLSAFNGQSPAGTWTLRVRDAVTGMFGTVNSASINICGQTYTLETPDFENIDFVLSPNPNKGSFTVQFESKSENGVSIFVHDILGKKVYENTFESTSFFSQNIQLQNISAGIYLVTVVDGDRRTVKKIVVN